MATTGRPITGGSDALQLPQTPDPRPQTPDPRPQTPDHKRCERCPPENYSDFFKSAAPFVCFVAVVFVSIMLALWRLEHITNFRRSGAATI